VTSSKSLPAVRISRGYGFAGPSVVSPISGEGGSGAAIYDSLSSATVGFGIAPGSSTWLVVRIPYGYSKCSARVDAILSADGSGEGNHKGMSSIYLRRRGIYKALERSIPQVEELASGQATLSGVLQKVESDQGKLAVALRSAEGGFSGRTNHMGLSGLAQSGPNGAGYGAPLPDPETGKYAEDEVASMNNFYTRLESALSSLGNAAQPGSQQNEQFPWKPPSAKQPSVDEIARQKGISRDRAQALVLCNELQQWRLALEGQIARPRQK